MSNCGHTTSVGHISEDSSPFGFSGEMFVNLVDKEMLKFEDKFVTPAWPPTPESENGHPYSVM